MLLAGVFDAEGQFCYDDVPAGRYCLTLRAYGLPAQARGVRGEAIGILTCPFTIPEMPDGRSNEPLNLGKLEFQPIGVFTRIPRLAGKSLPGFDGIQIDFDPAQALDKMVLVCFFDMQQRPSRHLLRQLAQQTGQLQDKGLTLIAVQGAKLDDNRLKEWIKENNIPFPVGMVTGDTEETRFAWGVKSLPWLILTDKEREVIAEGLSVRALETKLGQIKGE